MAEFVEHLNFLWRYLTVEPVAFLTMLSSRLTSIPLKKLILEKSCVDNWNFTDGTCKSLRNTQIEEMVQDYFANLKTYQPFVCVLIISIFMVLLGAWSDRTGRRILTIMIPIFAHIIHGLISILSVGIFDQLPMKLLPYLDSFHGNLVISGLFTYITGIRTSEKNIIFRLSFVSVAGFFGDRVGLAMSSVIFNKTSYYVVFAVAIVLHTISLIYVLLKLEDPPRTDDQRELYDFRGCLHFLRTFFAWNNIKDTVMLVFKSGEHQHQRLRICVMYPVVGILFGVMNGEMSILYMSTKKRFDWDEAEFGKFVICECIISVIGTIISITVFSKYLKWHDSILGIISTVSKIAACFVYAFAPNAIIFYIAPLVGILNGTSILAIRSIISKLAEKDEFGKMNSIFGVIENLMAVCGELLYRRVYKSTMENFPGAFFLMSTMTLLAVPVFMWLLNKHNKKEQNSTTPHIKDEEHFPENLSLSIKSSD